MPAPERPDDMRALIADIARALVDLSSEVQVREDDRGDSSTLRLKVAPSDVGKVIGKEGRTARAMRTILGAVSVKHHHRYNLDIVEDED